MRTSGTRGAGHIKNLGGGRWLVRTSHGRNARGARVRTCVVVHGTKREAQRRLTAVLRREDEGFAPVVGRQSLGEWSVEYLTDWTGHMAPRTRADARHLLERFFAYVPTLAGKRLTQLATADVQRAVNALSARGLGPRTVRLYHGALRAGLSKAVRLGKVAQNVALQVELPAQERRERLFLNPAEAEHFLQVLEESDDRFAALYAVMMLTGLRPGETCALKWGDLDGRSLRVRRSLVWVAGRVPQLADTKTRRSRVIALGDRVLRILQQHRARQAEWRLLLGATYEDEGLIFATETGAPLQLATITAHHFKPLLRAAGLPKLRLYDLRHTHATLLLAAGEHPKVVQERLGHSTITLTLDTYSHVVPGMQERAAERLDALLVQAAPKRQTGAHVGR